MLVERYWRTGRIVGDDGPYRYGLGTVLRSVRYFELPGADCRIVAQRTAWSSGCDTAWKYLQDDRCVAVAAGPDDREWSPRQATLLTAADELYRDRFLTDSTWAALDLTPPQRVDLCFLVGHLCAIAMVDNSFGRSVADRLISTPLRPGRTQADPQWLLPETPRLPHPTLFEAGPYWLFSRAVGALNGGGAIHGIEMLGRSSRTLTTVLPLIARARLMVRIGPDLNELATLRTTWNAGSEYHRYHHGEVGLLAGLTEDDVARVAAGPEDPAWTSDQRLVLRACDDLHRDRYLSDTTWAELTARFTPWQILDIIMIVANYEMLCMSLNSFGIQFETGSWRGGLAAPVLGLARQLAGLNRALRGPHR